MDIFLLIVGLIGLGVSAELIVRGASALARRYALSETFVGLGILSIGTDLPEIAIAVDASLRSLTDGGGGGVALGSAIGSSIAQISLVLGTVSLFGALFCTKRALKFYGLGLLGSWLLLFIVATGEGINRMEGTFLSLAYGAFFALLLFNRTSDDGDEEDASVSPMRAWAMLGAGFVLLLLTTELTVTAVLSLAETYMISEATLSVIILGLGSSLPELSLSTWALLRKRTGMSLGNLMGSNILDTLLAPGLAAMISPIIVEPATLWIDMPVLLFVTLLVLTFLWRAPDGIRRWQGLLILAAYLTYVTTRFSEAALSWTPPFL